MKKNTNSVIQTATGKTNCSNPVELETDNPNKLITRKELDEAIQAVREQSDKRYWNRDDEFFPEMGNHYQKLPSGLILQWGFAKQAVLGTEIKYPIPFPNEVFGVFVNGAQGDIHGLEVFNVVLKGTRSFQVFVRFPNGQVPSDCFWFALGR